MSEQTQVKRPRADAERNRARLLDAAKAAFSSGQAPSLEQIARDADVGIGTLYRHFPTREALVEALYRKELADICAGAADLLATHPPAAALQTILDAGIAAGTLRDDVRAEDIVSSVVGMFTATSLAGGREQLGRMLNLLMDAIRRPPTVPVSKGTAG